MSLLYSSCLFLVGCCLDPAFSGRRFQTLPRPRFRGTPIVKILNDRLYRALSRRVSDLRGTGSRTIADDNGHLQRPRAAARPIAVSRQL